MSDLTPLSSTLSLTRHQKKKKCSNVLIRLVQGSEWEYHIIFGVMKSYSSFDFLKPLKNADIIPPGSQDLLAVP